MVEKQGTCGGNATDQASLIESSRSQVPENSFGGAALVDVVRVEMNQKFQVEGRKVHKIRVRKDTALSPPNCNERGTTLAQPVNQGAMPSLMGSCWYWISRY